MINKTNLIKVHDKLYAKLTRNNSFVTFQSSQIWAAEKEYLPYTISLEKRYLVDQLYENYVDKVVLVNRSVISYLDNNGKEIQYKGFIIKFSDDIWIETGELDAGDNKLVYKFTESYPENLKQNIFRDAAFSDLTIVHSPEADYQEVLDILKQYECKRVKDKPEPEVNILCLEDGSLAMKSFKIKKNKIDIDLHYGKEFGEKYNNIIKRLNTEDDKGIVLLYGDPGSGKTHLIRYIISKIRHKDIIYMPPAMAENLSNPDFVTFLMDYPNSVLVLEDAEGAVHAREDGNYGSSVSNLLNLSDGILSDCLNMQIIVTFNTKRNKIDEALLRPGRLIEEHEFKALSIEDAQKLIDNLELGFVATEEMTLTQIYNHKEKDARKKTKTRKIGF